MNQKLTHSFVESLVTYLVTITLVILLGSAFSLAVADSQIQFSGNSSKSDDPAQHLSILVDGLRISYRQSGSENAPVILLLQGKPSPSSILQNMLTSLSERFHVLAPELPVSGNSDKPVSSRHLLSNDDMAVLMDGFITKLGVPDYGLLVMNHATPIAVRMILNNPQQVRFLLLQNGDKFEDHLPKISASIQKFWARKPEYSNSVVRLVKPAETRKQRSRSIVGEAIISLNKLTTHNTNLKSRLKPGLKPGDVFKTKLLGPNYFF